MVARAALFVFITSTCLYSQDAKQRPAEQIKKDIEELQKKLAELQKELQAVSPVDLNVAIRLSNPKVGIIGRPIGTFRIVKILSEDSVIAVDINGSNPHFILKGWPTKDQTEKKRFSLDDKAWIVSKTEKLNDQTYYVVEPYLPASKK